MPRSSASLKYNKKVQALGKLDNLREMISFCAEQYGGQDAFTEVKNRRTHELDRYSYLDLKNDTDSLGTALLDLGLKGKHIAIVGENRYRWVVSYFTVINGVGVVCPLDKELKDEDIGRLMSKADADVLITTSGFCNAKSFAVWKQNNPSLRTIVMMDEFPAGIEADDVVFYRMDDLFVKGKELLAQGDTSYTESSLDPEAMSAILFTSGTMGANKGVMLSLKNITSNLWNVVENMDNPSESIILLPMNHSYEFNCHIMGGMLAGMSFFINGSLRYLMPDLQEQKPKMSCVVPLFLDMISRNMLAEAKKTKTDKVFRRSIRLSNGLRHVGIDIRDKIFKVVKVIFGGELQFMVCGGAPVDPSAVRLLDSVGIDVDVGYGITECSPLVSLNTDTRRHPDSVGIPVQGASIFIAEPDGNGVGEICVKGDMVMLGYYKDETATKDSFTDDGYFRTGDYGRLDKAGRLYITGRKKNLIILENGKNVQPEEIEEVILEQLPYVREVVVYETQDEKGGAHKYIEAAFYVDKDTVVDSGGRDQTENMLKEDLRKVNRKLPAYKNIQFMWLSDTEFNKTSTRKIRRQDVVENNSVNSKVKL